MIFLKGQTHRTLNRQRVEVPIEEGCCHVIKGIPIEFPEYLVFLIETKTYEISSQINLLGCTVVLEVGMFLNPEDGVA